MMAEPEPKPESEEPHEEPTEAEEDQAYEPLETDKLTEADREERGRRD